MKKYYILVLIILVLLGTWLFRSGNLPGSSNEPSIVTNYTNPEYGFSLFIPEGFTKDEAYKYQMTPDKSMGGVKFTIPESLRKGTNLSSDSYISFEKINGLSNDTCVASAYLVSSEPELSTTSNKIKFSVAYSVGVGAGNIYEERVFATPFKDDCVALRYFIHYGNIGNYPEGAVVEFNKDELNSIFDSIRKTLILK